MSLLGNQRSKGHRITVLWLNAMKAETTRLAISEGRKASWRNPNSAYHSQAFHEKRHQQMLTNNPMFREEVKRKFEADNNWMRSKEGREFLSKNNPMYNPTVSRKFKGENNPSKRQEVRDKIAAIRKQQWANPESVYNSQVFREAQYKGLAMSPNEKEKQLSYILRTICPHHFRYNGDYRLGISFDRLVPDFVNINGVKQVIELFGDYWHGETLRGASSEEMQRVKTRYAKCGIDCLIIWESELRDRQKVKQLILGFIQKERR